MNTGGGKSKIRLTQDSECEANADVELIEPQNRSFNSGSTESAFSIASSRSAASESGMGHSQVPRYDGDAGLDLEPLIDELGVGRYQWTVMLTCALANAVDAVEVMSLAYILPAMDELPPWVKGAVSSAVFAGMLVGGLSFGYMADWVGRRPVLLTTMALNCLFTLVFSFATSFETMVLLRFLTGFGVGGSVAVVFAMPAEAVPAEWRGTAVAVVASAWMVGSIVVAGTAWAVIPTLGWRWFAALCAVPPAVAVVLVLSCVHESHRFLLAKGRTEEAAKVMEGIYRFNGKPLPVKDEGSHEDGEQEIPLVLRRIPAVEASESIFAKFQDLFSTRLRVRTGLLGVVWVGICYGWYGLNTWIPTILKDRHVELCFAKSGSDSCLYQSALLVALASLPGNLLSVYLADRVDRNLLMAGSLLISGAAALSAYYSVDPVGTGVLFCLFNAASTLAWNILDLLSTEMFPTTIRGFVMGFLSSLGRVASSIAQVQFSVLGPETSLPICATALAIAAFATFGLPNLAKVRLADI